MQLLKEDFESKFEYGLPSIKNALKKRYNQLRENDAYGAMDEDKEEDFINF